MACGTVAELHEVEPPEELFAFLAAELAPSLRWTCALSVFALH